MQKFKEFSLAFIAFIVSSCSTVVESETKEFLGFEECTTPGLVALTFGSRNIVQFIDDGPSPNGGTQSVLNVLREEGVKATFFVTGRGHDKTWLDSDERKQSLLRQIFAEGHQIGSHTWRHSNLIQSMRKEELHEEIDRIATTVHNILGINMTVLRPPFGLMNTTVMKFIEQEFGYQVVGWCVNTLDWVYGKNITASFKKYEDEPGFSMSLNSSFITLHHDPVPRSGDLARKAIQFVRSKGFRLVTVGECIGVPNFL